MGSGPSYLAALATVDEISDPDERRRAIRQGLAVLAHVAEREPAPLEGMPPDRVLAAVKVALADELLDGMDWLSPSAAAVALFELAQALPPGPERRELGRRVLTRLRDADRDTFVRLLISLARSSPKLLGSEGLRARTEVVLSAPLTAPGMLGELALALLAQPSLARDWVELPAMGALPGRRLAARILAHGAREAVRRHDAGDRGGVRILARASIRAGLARLLGDREALVWRFAGIARGLLAHVDSDLADDIDRELRPTATGSELRRASASAAAALELGGAAARWEPTLIERAASEPGVTRGAILGLAGLAVRSPDAADQLAEALVGRAGLDGAEALVELRREEGPALLPRATAAALIATRAAIAQLAATAAASPDDGKAALLHALEAELTGGATSEGLAAPLAAAREALDAGDVPRALVGARAALDELAAAAEWLAEASDDDALDRRHTVRLLRELDRELLADHTLTAVLALTPPHDPARATFARLLASVEAALLAREAEAPPGATVPQPGLRMARLRALVRLLDGVGAPDAADLEPRLAAVRRLMGRAALDHSPLRRAVWAAMTRAGDALLRDGHAEVTDLLLSWTTAFPEDDFSIVREASMVPEVEAAFEAYARLHQATWVAADPDDHDALREVVVRLGDLADALPAEQSPRVESVRLILARLASQLVAIAEVVSLDALPVGALETVGIELAALARRAHAAQVRLGLPSTDLGGQLEAALRGVIGDRDARGLDEALGIAIGASKQGLPPAIAAAIERILVWLARRPATGTGDLAAAPSEAKLPGWVPLSRLLGAFYVVRPIGRGAGGSVLLAVRADERQRPDRELVALKVPDYTGGAARNLSLNAFEALFREEAGALLALPAHKNLAGFITFDASARPKPILVMEYVRGQNLERALEVDVLDTSRAMAIIDDLLAGLDAMHKEQIAHLDVKPANVVLRDGDRAAVLVDFGLAGRRLRPGCGSPHYGAHEVWSEGVKVEPFGADVYAAGCVAFEVLTNRVLIHGNSVRECVDNHFVAQPGQESLDRLERTPRVAPVAQLLRAAVSRDPRKRPTAARLRAGFAAIARDLKAEPWPLKLP